MNKFKIIIISIFLSFLILTPTLSAKLEIGKECAWDSDCKTDQCEFSTQTDDKGDKKAFCVCGESDLSIASGDYSYDCADRYNGTKDDWTCKDGAIGTWNLNYCLHNKDVNKTKPPIPPKDLSFLEQVVDQILDPTAAYNAIYENEIENIVKRKPILQIGIPGLENFSEGKTTEESGQIYVHIPFLSEYLAGLYKYGVVIASIIAVVMIINNGLKWTISGGSPEKIKEAQTRILQSITGLLLAVGSYALLYNINPELVQFKNLRIRAVTGIPLSEMDKYLIAEGSLGPELAPGTTAIVSGGASPTAGVIGPWRTEMLSTETCGSKNNMGLPMEERKKALAKIIKRWKYYSADEGGAIYVHGGYYDCSYSNASVKFLIQSMSHLIVKNKTSDFSPGFLSTPCGQLITKINSDLGLNGKYGHDSSLINKWMGSDSERKNKTTSSEQQKNYEVAQKCTKTKPEKSMVETITSFPRTYGWKLQYDYLLTKRAKQTNMICGDCGTFLVGLFTGCFDKSYNSGLVKNSEKETIRFSTNYEDFRKNIKKYVKQLKFGDVIKTTDVGHYMLYTGGSGDSSIDFEILEMGGGGGGDTIGKGLAVANSGTPLANASGVKSWKSAVDFFEKMGMKFTNITAYGVIDKKGTSDKK